MMASKAIGSPRCPAPDGSGSWGEFAAEAIAGAGSVEAELGAAFGRGLLRWDSVGFGRSRGVKKTAVLMRPLVAAICDDPASKAEWQEPTLKLLAKVWEACSSLVFKKAAGHLEEICEQEFAGVDGGSEEESDESGAGRRRKKTAQGTEEVLGQVLSALEKMNSRLERVEKAGSPGKEGEVAGGGKRGGGRSGGGKTSGAAATGGGAKAEGFREAGPLSDLASAARALLGRVEGGRGAEEAEAEEERTGGGARGKTPGREKVGARAVAGKARWGAGEEEEESDEGEESRTVGGRLILSAGRRRAGIGVALKIKSAQGEAIYEEWSNAGTERLQEAVAARSWKVVEAKRAGFAVGRALDVMKDSGLDITREPAGEVLLRELAALWYGDKHPRESDVAEWLRESSMSIFGVPRGLLEEARTMRKLTKDARGGGEKEKE